ncbi:sn-glycerol-3-phosphate ABC transporter ATP-binding protein UgpC [Alsobacter sp. SYSU M60028]|uniref:Sn-glycerol-3-phosphate ABC transporter ATP-binding protein UgpC n=1 Tax=Alsobacter ponti TaxID=2962936 RepID=A0ABT1L8M0_9HYPH|nr:sn-glycerol-3-phosphate ABC transporter ATP-binding protein UgpC [Alsobacter ponti]MCP8937421.1 sn-glycerol-3-phosphate ABC transporter ATP-binding protein UgpC [Alsobacter ponti]
MANVNVRKLVKSFGDATVLRGIDVDVRDGEFLSLVGPSGCGKSTLLRMIAGLEPISAGDIVIDGKVVNGLAAKDRDIAMVFQNYALYPHMTVRENMSFALEMRGLSKAEIAASVASAAAILGLEALLDRYPRQMSGGQQQRVAMGRAIVRDPKVFLFDEPLSNLDAKLRVQMRTEIKDLHARLGSTIIYVTHDQLEAMTMADRIVVMRAGVIEQIGTPLDLYDRPGNSFVGSFIGSPAMNLVRCTVAGGDTGPVCVTAGNQILARLPVTKQVAAGATVDVGIRPEDLEVGASGPHAQVVVVEPTGPETQVTASLDGQIVRLVVKGRSSLNRGDKISLRTDSEKLHIFDAETGTRI